MHTVVRRTLLVVVFASLVIIGISAFRLTTQAAASSSPSTSPLQGIGAAQGVTVGLDSTARGELQALASGGVGGSIAGQTLSNARALNTTVAGHPTYVVPSNTGDFCFFVENLGETCRAPLTPNDPVMFTVSDPDGPGGVGPTAWGVALDGVESVSFTEQGDPETVPVSGNVFEFSGAASATVDDFGNVVANFADGHVVPAN